MALVSSLQRPIRDTVGDPKLDLLNAAVAEGVQQTMNRLIQDPTRRVERIE